MKNIVLIGFMGSGKSTVGKILRERTGMELLDSDREIEKQQKCKICDIFAGEGENAFRKMETAYLDFLAGEKRPFILSTGGGMPLIKENAERMKKIGCVIYLKAAPETIYGRLKEDTERPLLQNTDKRKKIEQLLAIRDPLYSQAADWILETDDNNLERVVTEIMEYIKAD